MVIFARGAGIECHIFAGNLREDPEKKQETGLVPSPVRTWILT